MDEIAAIGILAGVAITLGVPAIIAGHLRKMAEIKLRTQQTHQQADQNQTVELRELKKQVAELRDTTTQYDMSFDAALQRMESRVASVEQRQREGEREDTTAQVQRG